MARRERRGHTAGPRRRPAARGCAEGHPGVDRRRLRRRGPTTPVPLTEDATLRPNPGFAPAVHAAEVERLPRRVERGAPCGHGQRPCARRPCSAPGPSASRPRLLLGRPPLRVPGAPAHPCRWSTSTTWSPRSCFAVGNDLPGTYNVAADGWLGTDDARALLPRSLLPPRLPAELLERGPGAPSWARRPRGHSPDRRALPRPPRGSSPTTASAPPAGARNHTNEEAIIEGLDSLPSARYGQAVLLRRRPEPPRAGVVTGPSGGAGVFGGVVAERGGDYAPAGVRFARRQSFHSSVK